MQKYGRPDRLRMPFEFCLPKATNIPPEYVIFIVFPRQQWLRERAWCYLIRALPVLLRSAHYSLLQEIKTI